MTRSYVVLLVIVAACEPPRGTLAATAREQASISTADDEPARHEDECSFPGVLLASQRVVLAASSAGRLREFDARIGRPAPAGDVLFSIEDLGVEHELARAEGDYARARAEQGVARRRRERARRERDDAKLIAAHIARAELDATHDASSIRDAELSAAAADLAWAGHARELGQRRRDQLAVRSPFAGRIAEVYAAPGQYVEAGEPVLRWVAEAPTLVRFAVEEAAVGQLAVGQRVHWSAPASGAEGVAAITDVGAEVESRSGLVVVAAELVAGSQPVLRSGAAVDVRPPSCPR